MVYVLVKGERVDVKDTTKITLFDERRLPVVIEKEETDDKDEWPYPGFSRQLIGLKAKDKKELDYTFPKDYDSEELQGAQATFSVSVEEIKGRILPEINDDFAASLGDYENLEALQEEINASLKDRRDAEQNADYDDKIFDKLIKETAFKYPPQMIEHEVEHAVEDIERDLRSQGLDLEAYLKSREIDEPTLREELSGPAEERIKRSLLLMEIAKAEDIQVNEDDVRERTEKTIAEINQIFPEDQARRLTSGQSLQSLVNRIINDEIVSQTLARLRAIAKGEETEAEKPANDKKKKEAEEQKQAEAVINKE
jgi:trigger factor